MEPFSVVLSVTRLNTFPEQDPGLSSYSLCVSKPLPFLFFTIFSPRGIHLDYVQGALNSGKMGIS